jgi:hypothetical protein
LQLFGIKVILTLSAVAVFIRAALLNVAASHLRSGGPSSSFLVNLINLELLLKSLLLLYLSLDLTDQVLNVKGLAYKATAALI